MMIRKDSPNSYYEKLAQADREAFWTVMAAFLVTVFFWSVIDWTKESLIFWFGLPLWFWLSCIGGYILSVVVVILLVKYGFKNFDLDLEAKDRKEK